MSNSPDLGLVLSFMRPSLRQKTQINYYDVVEETLGRMADADIFSVPANQRTFGLHQAIRDNDPLYSLIVEAFHYLLHTGLITRQPNRPNFPSEGNQFIVTQRGTAWAAGEEPIPEDATRYMEVLGSLVPNLDSIIRQYVEESLIAYQRQAYFAAAVMIGAACEKAVYLLADSFLRSIQGANEKKKLNEAMRMRSISRLFDAIQEILKTKSKKIPYDVTEGTEQHILSFFDSVRVQRNEAVHPNAALVTPSKVHLSLAAFPHACEKVYELIGWLDANPI
jgi:hypothetical protein